MRRAGAHGVGEGQFFAFEKAKNAAFALEDGQGQPEQQGQGKAEDQFGRHGLYALSVIED
jgi:hypothetical protein